MFSQKKKGFIPSPLPLTPKKIKRRFSFSAIKGECLAFPCLVKNAKNALLHFLNAFLTPRQGREVVCTSCNIFESGKALMGLFKVVDSETVILDSVRLNSKFKSKFLNLESKPLADSGFYESRFYNSIKSFGKLLGEMLSLSGLNSLRIYASHASRPIIAALSEQNSKGASIRVLPNS